MPGRAGSMQASCLRLPLPLHLSRSLCLVFIVVFLAAVVIVVIGAIDAPICPSIARVG